jgi:hypothetical protein
VLCVLFIEGEGLVCVCVFWTLSLCLLSVCGAACWLDTICARLRAHGMLLIICAWYVLQGVYRCVLDHVTVTVT